MYGFKLLERTGRSRSKRSSSWKLSWKMHKQCLQTWKERRKKQEKKGVGMDPAAGPRAKNEALDSIAATKNMVWQNASL